MECITQWAKKRENPVCPLCFLAFDSVILMGNREQRLETGTEKEIAMDAGFEGLDSSFFLGDLEVLLQRTRSMHQRTSHKTTKTQLHEVLISLDHHKLRY